MSTTEMRYWAAYFVYKNKMTEESYARMKQEPEEKEEPMTLGRQRY